MTDQRLVEENPLQQLQLSHMRPAEDSSLQNFGRIHGKQAILVRCSHHHASPNVSVSSGILVLFLAR